MDFDDSIDTITPDIASLLLTIGGTGALQIPSGSTAQQPTGAVAGAMRWNTTVPRIEYFNGTVWSSFGTGTVTSVSGSGGTTGLTLSGGPITTSGTLTLGGTLAIANGGTGQTTAAAAFNALSPLTTLGDIIYANGTNTATRLAGNTSTTTQVLTQTGNGTISAAPIWSSVGAASYSVNVGPSGTIAWSLVSGNTYNAVITHNLGTQNVVVQMADISNNQVVNSDLITINSTTQVTVQVVGNTRTLRVVIIANGASIAAGGSTPSSVLVNANGVAVSGGPFTTLNFTGYSTAPTGASGTATVNLSAAIPVQLNGTAVTGSPFTTINFAGSTLTASSAGGIVTITDTAAPVQAIRTMTYVATSFDSPNSADWTVNALAATIADATNNAITVRTFSNTVEQGVGFTIPIPSNATNIIFAYQGRPVTAPGTASTVAMKLYTRTIANVTTPAAPTAWSAATTFTSDTVPTNAFYQTYSHTYTLAALSLTAGNVVQFELTRAASGVASFFNLLQLTVSFT